LPSAMRQLWTASRPIGTQGLARTVGLDLDRTMQPPPAPRATVAACARSTASPLAPSFFFNSPFSRDATRSDQPCHEYRDIRSLTQRRRGRRETEHESSPILTPHQ